jgi:PAS domain S-box-containing protein
MPVRTEWSSALKGAHPRIAPAANGETPLSIFGDVNGLTQEVIGALPVAVYMTDADGRLTFYNKAAVALWGCLPALGERKFCGSWKLYLPDGTALPHDACPMAMALRQRRSIPGMEIYAERPDGTRIPFIPYPTPLFDASGRLTGAVNMLVDISERKRAEVALEERNAQFELASRIALIGNYSYDYNTKILQLSRACAAIYGLPEGVREITQEDWRARVHPDDLPRIDATCRQALAQRQAELVLEFRIIRSGGGKDRWIEARILVSYDDAGRAVQMIGANIDVTERKQTAQDLAERTVQLALAERAARVGSYAYDLDSEIMQISEGYVAIHGFPNGTTEIARSKCLAGVHREDIDRVRQLRSDAFRNASPEYNVEYRIVGSDGEFRWVETRCFIAYGREGRPLRVIGVSIDVSERKRAEEQQRALLAELDHRVKNVLATVSAITHHTKAASTSMDAFVTALDTRIYAMASTHELLSSCQWEGVPLRQLLLRELAPYASSNNTCIEGPCVVLGALAAQTTAFVLHELATNAAKYGAYSIPQGRVSVRWSCAPNGQKPGALTIEWLETGGPAVEVPKNKSGYGRSVITELVPYELGGTARLLFPTEGVRCRLDIPGNWLAPAMNKSRGRSITNNAGEPAGNNNPCA